MKKLSNEFKFLYFSQLFANTGDILYIVGLIGYIFEHTQSAQASVYIPITITFSLFISGWFAPYVYSKWLKKDILSFCQSVKSGLMLVIFLSMITDQNSNVLYYLAALNAFLDGFTNPLKMTLIPQLERKELISYANAQMSMMNGLVQIGSWALGGFLLMLGSETIIIITVILYLLSLLFINQLKLIQDVRDTSQLSVSHSFKEMLRTNLTLAESHFLTIHTLFESIGHSVWIAAILLVYVSERLDASDKWFGIINATFFIGVLLGGIILARKNNQLMNHAYLYIIFIPLALSVINVSFGYTQVILFALLLSLIFGILDEIRSTLLHTKIQLSLDDEKLTALYTLNGMIHSFCFSVSSFISAAVADHFSVTIAFYWAAIAYVGCFIISMKYRKLFN
ncbi:MFS transporter [Macrococcus brunensis]|uniref:MFS transporter n=1 Tax=Macrococcus brunensis TaxID=198483 RepID=UPI001EF0881F|nr:MFS transporter [Macrococcus brunensis]ULG74549.1 MFS transporter [Macrococcus brunensis]